MRKKRIIKEPLTLATFNPIIMILRRITAWHTWLLTIFLMGIIAGRMIIR